jgi:hypothetical protein
MSNPITITLSFATMAEAAAFLSGTKLPAGASAGATATAASTPATGAKATTKPANPPADVYVAKNTKEAMTAQMNLVKEKFGTATAKELIAASGHAKLSEVTDAKKIDALFDAAAAKMAEPVDPPAGDDNDM